MSAKASDPPGPELWQARYLRLIAFPVEPAFQASRDWWQRLTGAEPATSTEKRQQQEREDSGNYEDVSISLSVNLVRVQLTVERPGLPVDPENPVAIASIGAFLERRGWFEDLMGRWLDQAPPIKRLSFSGSLIQPVPGHRLAYERLNQYLRRVDLDPETSDFIYRINRLGVTRTAMPGLEVNRLATWVALKMTMERQLELVGSPEGAQRFPVDPLYAAMVEFDVNSTQLNTTPLQHQELRPLFRELGDFALEIATCGEAR